MASIRKYRGKWRAEIARQGVRKSKVFETKAEAVRWAAGEEATILVEVKLVAPGHTFSEGITRYIQEVSPRKKGTRFEKLRLEALIRDFPSLTNTKLSELSTPQFVAWREARLRVVTRGSVQRELNLIRNVLTVIREEWHWIKESPLKGMRMPGDNPPRTRLVQPHEVKKVLRWCGYHRNMVPSTKTQEVGLAFLVALRTGMRAGELLSLSKENVDLKRQVATVEHKSQHITGKPREIPLSKHAVRILTPLLSRDKVFSITSASLDAMFRKLRKSLLLKDLHFHDTRATALTRFARKVDAMVLARISGHRDLRTLMDHYYRTTSDDIARRI
jgi:integrase